jgi:hypothetical protein
MLSRQQFVVIAKKKECAFSCSEEEEKHHRMRFENIPKWQQKHQCI